ncbi:RDD family protein [Rhodococcoides kroppenstedtii]|uniref:RDD family protein n=1 Tax=Rhodococcoides kroppenstedtii TaxID=293050 RepID=UPI003627E101
MTSGGFDPGKDPQNPGGYPPPQGNYPPPQGNYPPPQGNYPPPQGNYPPPQQPYQGGGYPTPPQFQNTGPGAGRPGTLGRRFGARLIDGILVGIVVAVLSLLTGTENSILATGLFSGFLLFVYFVAMEVTQGATLGKKILGLSVRGPGGGTITLQQSAIRNAFMLLTIIPFLGGLLAFIAYIVIAVTINSSPTKQGKHDEFAGGTQVVEA